MFNFSFLKCYQKKVIFCVSVFVVATNFSLSQASASTANNSDNTYKNKIYANIGYMNIDSNMDIMLYGIGAETKLPNSIEISCNYATGNTQSKKDVDKSFQYGTKIINITSKKQKSADKSHIVNLTGKYHYNDILFQADFVYSHLANNFKTDMTKGQQAVAGINYILKANITSFTVNLGKNFAINDNLYLFPQCSVGFNKNKNKLILKGSNYTTHQIGELTLLDETTDTVEIIPELVIGGDLFLPTAIKINPEISFSYSLDTKKSSNNKFHIDFKINMEINQFYVAIESDSINESDTRNFLIKLGVLF